MESRGILSCTFDSKLVLLGAGIALGALVPKFFLFAKKRLQAVQWRDHVDDDHIQICLYSTEHLMTLGRVEKRTIFMSEVASFFGDNQVILEKVMTAALKVSEECPFVARFLSQEDRWHIMNICLNRVSALFGPFHVFFNEARRCKSPYRSAWYLYTLTSQQNVHRGRFFVSPYKPVLSWVDRGVKRLRVDLVSEQEMRDIASGVICPPDWGFFNNRHKQRWDLLVRMSELFENQLVILDSSDNLAGEDSSLDESPRSPESWQSVRHEDECVAPSRVSRHTSNPRELAAKARRTARKHDVAQCKHIDNCIMRVHIPFPSSDTSTPETSSKDVVLFE